MHRYGIIVDMSITYCYRTKLSAEQKATMFCTSELLWQHWDYALSQRLDWLSRTRCKVNRGSLVSELIGEIPEWLDYYTQQTDLKQTKLLYPEYQNIWAEKQQVNLQRLKKAWEQWMVPYASSKRGDRPRFKKPWKLRSFVYPRINCSEAGAYLYNGVLKLSKIAEMPVVMHQLIVAGVCSFLFCTVVLNRGEQTVEVSDRGSSIECSNCGMRAEKTLRDRSHGCSGCLLSIDRDWNSALVLLNRELRAVGLPFSDCGGLKVTQQLKQQFLAVISEAPVTASA